jgi:hypothetical protein
VEKEAPDAGWKDSFSYGTPEGYPGSLSNKIREQQSRCKTQVCKVWKKE